MRGQQQITITITGKDEDGPTNEDVAATLHGIAGLVAYEGVPDGERRTAFGKPNPGEHRSAFLSSVACSALSRVSYSASFQTEADDPRPGSELAQDRAFERQAEIDGGAV